MTMQVVYHESSETHELTVEDVRSALDRGGFKPKRDANGYRAICPAHQDADGHSMTVHPKDGGGVLLRCHSRGCMYQDILKALNLWRESEAQVAGMFRNAHGRSHEPIPAAYTVDDSRRTHYIYQNAAGEELYQNVRRQPKGFWHQRVLPTGEVVKSLGAIEQVPYGLPELAAGCYKHLIVHITEGEKDAVRLRAEGYLAISIADSQEARSGANARLLRGRNVVIHEDNDKKGRERAESLVKWLSGVAADIRVMRYTNLPEKGDVSDWWDDGGTRQAFESRLAALEPLSASGAVEWVQPSPISLEYGPEFDAELLPDNFRDYCESLADAYQVPLAMSVTVALGAISAAVAGRFTLYRWDEPVHGYFVGVSRPGTKKSALMSAITGVLLRWQAERQQRDRLAIAEWESANRALVKQRDRLEGEPRKGERAGPDRDLLRVAAVQALHEHEESKPVLTQLIVDDATAQAVAWMLIEQQALAVISAEAAYLENFIRYGDTPDYNAFLQGHSGDPLHVHRRGGQSAYTEHAYLSLCMAIQPHALRKMGGVDGFLQRGGCARLMMALPEDIAGSRLTGRRVPPMSQRATSWWDARILALLDQRQGKAPPTPLPMTESALEVADRFEATVEDRYRFLGDDDPMRAWSSKQVGAALRIAGLLHLIEYDAATPVSEATIRRGINISEWYREHAEIAFKMMEGSSDSLALTVWKVLQSFGTFSVNRRELHIKLRGRSTFKRSSDLEDPLSELEEFGYIRRREISPEGAGRPAEWIDLNPLSFPAKHSQNTQNPVKNDGSGLRPTGTDGFVPRFVEEI